MWPARQDRTGLGRALTVQSVGVVNPPSRHLLSLVFEHLNQSHGANKTVQWMWGGEVDIHHVVMVSVLKCDE